MIKEILLKFAEAWDNQNINEIALLFTKDCVYKASVGPEPGKTFIGKENVMIGIKNMINNDSGGKGFVENTKIFEDFAVSEWNYVFEDKSKIFGCDLFEFEGDKIKMINAFRKTSL